MGNGFYKSVWKDIAGVLLDCDVIRIARGRRRVHDWGGDRGFTPSSWKEHGMAFEDKEAELGLLLTRMQNEPDDLHEVYEQIRLKLNELKAYGMPLPADLVQFEHDLEAVFAEEQEDAERQTRIDKVIADRAKR